MLDRLLLWCIGGVKDNSLFFISTMEEKKLNKIRDVLREQGRTNKWLSAQLGKNEVTISRWCRNVQQPDLETLYRIAHLLSIPVCDLLVDDYTPDEPSS